MIYNETMSGGAVVNSCASIFTSHIYTTLYGIGDALYSAPKARRGVLEKIVIKQIVPIKASLVGGMFVVMYKDTFNGLWNEDELITLDDAKALAIAYYNFLLAQIQDIERRRCTHQ